jgi:sortase A
MLLGILAVGSLLCLNHAGRTDDETLGPAMTPSIEQEASEGLAGGAAFEKEAAMVEPSTGEASKGTEEGKGTAAPDDPTLYLSVPRLGLYDNTVRNDSSEAALDLGAVKLPYTGFPWEKGANTYIACHRLGWPNTESFDQCLNLPSMQKGDEVILKDANGTIYRYRVVDAITVDPNDTWVTDPVAGREIVSLQTCIEAPGDLYTLGPNWSTRFVVRAQRVEEEQPGTVETLMEESFDAYAGLLHPSYYFYGSMLRAAKGVTHYAEGLFTLAGLE